MRAIPGGYVERRTGSVGWLILAAATGTATPACAQQAVAPGTIQLDAVEVEGRTDPDAVTGPLTASGYVGTAGTTATKTNTKLLDTPQSVSNVTQQQIEDRKPQNLTEALGYTPGVMVGAFGFDPRFDSFTVRGVDLTYTGVFRDGLRQLNSPNGLFRLEPYDLQGITILRGPAAAIYGASSTGGIVDLISKRPTTVPFHEIELQTGSYGRAQAAFDLSGPVVGAPGFYYRLTGLARQAGTQLAAVPDDRVFIAPALTWAPDNGTKLTILGEYGDALTGGSVAYDNTYAPYVAADGSVSFQSTGATRTPLSDKAYNDFRQQQGRIGYEFEHAFADNFVLHQNMRFSALGTKEEYNSLGAADGLVRERNAGVSVDTYLVSLFATGPIGHKLLTGVDYSHLDYTSRQGYAAVPLGEDPPINYIERQRQDLVGSYVQDQAALGPFRLTAGARHDWFSSRFANGAPGGDPAIATQSEGIWTGRTGLSFVTGAGLVPYLSYGTSFTPNPGVSLSGAVAQPTTGQQFEAGVKYDIPGSGLSLRAAAFDLHQQNAVVYQVVTGVNRQVQLDLASKGVELEAVANLADGLNLQASYSFNDARIERLTGDTIGNRLSSIPYHMASAWLDYTASSGWAQGAGIGGGVRYIGSSFGDALNRPVLSNKPRTVLDGEVHYDLAALDPRFTGARLQLNATNLLDERRQVCASGYCYYDEGRRVIASLRYRW